MGAFWSGQRGLGKRLYRRKLDEKNREHLLFDLFVFRYRVGDSPLGNFAPQKKNPVSRSREGFIRGGGHGSIVDGPNGTMWCFYTIPVCVDAIMERRIGMDPVGVDAEGNLYAKTGFPNPQFAPGVKGNPETCNDAGLIPLTVFKPTLASSYAPGHLPLYGVDETMHTWWQPAQGDEEPSFGVLLQGMYQISGPYFMEGYRP